MRATWLKQLFAGLVLIAVAVNVAVLFGDAVAVSHPVSVELALVVRHEASDVSIASA